MERTIVMMDNASASERSHRNEMLRLFRECPIPNEEILANLWLFIKRQDLSGMLFMNEIYQKILDVHGIIMEFGVRWGRNLALLSCLRGIYEPFNHNRKIMGFDTFEGFPSVDGKDGEGATIKVGAYDVTKDYDSYLAQILAYHESECPISHIQKWELHRGDASVTLAGYLKRQPETIIAFAYFDLDLYKPTRDCLRLVLDHVTKGSVIGFDELNVAAYPGETVGAKEVLGDLKGYRVHHSRFSPTQSYLVI